MKEAHLAWSIIMEPGLRTRKNRLAWLVKFIQTDLNNLSQGERSRLNIAFIALYGGEIERRAPKDKNGNIHWPPRKGLSRIQTDLRKFFDSLLEQQRSGFPIRLPSKSKELVITPDGKYQIEYPILVSIKHIVDTAPLISEFGDLLAGLPKDTIRKCPECGKFFVHISLKPKIYHSTKCANAAIYRKRIDQLKREGKYEDYLNGQKKKMRIYYKKTPKKKEVG
jgi:hypothetical protein